MNDFSISDSNYTWKKVEEASNQIGLREGTSDGRDNNFQNSFDKGYVEGFKNGYLLGKIKGFLLYQKNQHSNSEILNNPALEKVSRGDCVICQQPNLLENDIKEMKNQQEIIYSKHQKLLKD